MTYRPVLPFVLLGALLATACERAPTGPEMDDLANLLSTARPAAATSRIYSSTLPALFRESVARLEQQQGQTGAAALLADWRQLKHDLEADAVSSSRAAVQAKVEAIHDEELRIVERVLGSRALTKVIGDASVGLAEAEAAVVAAEANGEDVAAARSVLAEANAHMKTARNAVNLTENRHALDEASKAAALLAGLHYFLVESRRIPGLETMVPRAIEKLKAGNDAAADPALLDLEQLNGRARAALRSGNRSDAHTLLAELRTRQIALVVRALGAQSAEQLTTRVAARAKEVAVTVATLKSTGRDVLKLERMLRESVDMNVRAQNAFKAGDAATALDLASHAAGLLNAVQHLTWN
jgi:hypothetical protein